MQRILIIDDNPAALHAYSEFLALREPSIAVTTATSAEAALESMEMMVFDVVVCDFRLPGMDGLGFVRACRDAGRDPSIILVTGFGTIELEEEAAQQGVYAVLHKPVDPHALLSVVKRAFLHKWLRRFPGSGFALEPEPTYSLVSGATSVGTDAREPFSRAMTTGAVHG
jgi:DNA-binding NtrC family response regulator